jgi:hypothetical protein
MNEGNSKRKFEEDDEESSCKKKDFVEKKIDRVCKF